LRAMLRSLNQDGCRCQFRSLHRTREGKLPKTDVESPSTKKRRPSWLVSGSENFSGQTRSPGSSAKGGEKKFENQKLVEAGKNRFYFLKKRRDSLFINGPKRRGEKRRIWWRLIDWSCPGRLEEHRSWTCHSRSRQGRRNGNGGRGKRTKFKRGSAFMELTGGTEGKNQRAAFSKRFKSDQLALSKGMWTWLEKGHRLSDTGAGVKSGGMGTGARGSPVQHNH